MNSEQIERLRELARQKNREAELPQRARDADECRADADAIEAAVELAERLPVTADGVRVTPGMRVWPELLNDYEDDLDDGGVVIALNADGEIEISDSQGEKGPSYLDANAANVYSTREAAAATRGVEGE